MASRQVLFVILISASIAASPVTPIDIAHLIANSDVAVVCDINTVNLEETSQKNLNGVSTPVDVFVAHTTVIAVLKGGLRQSDLSFRFTIPRGDAGHSYKRTVPGTRRLVFLRSSVGGYDFTDPHSPSVPASGNTKHQSSNPEINAIAQVVDVVQSKSTSIQDKLEAIIDLRTAKSEEIVPAFRTALNFPDASEHSEFRGYLLAELLNHGDISVLPLVGEILMKEQPGFPEHVVHNLSYSLSRVRDPRGVDNLAALLSASRLETRRYAAEGLRHLGSRAVPALVVALGDTDEDVRYLGVIGLADVSKVRGWRPSEEEFKYNQQKYLSFWQEWAKGR